LTSCERRPWDDLLIKEGPVVIVEQRISELLKEDPSLLPRHAERIADLETEVSRWRHRALTDPITGLLSERAHIVDSEVTGRGHLVMEIPDGQAVYDYCGQNSGNVFLRDIVAALLPEAARHEARFYRIGTAKLAAITRGIEEAAELGAVLKRILGSLTVTCAFADGRLLPPRGPGSATLVDLLATQDGTFGAAVRAAFVGSIKQ
jgi:hypothetical protein